MEIEEWLGADNEAGLKCWHKKYQNNGETFEQWLDRVSAGDLEVKRLIREKKFLFGGRVLAARGIESNQSYSNCYVIKAPEDNLESIFDCCKQMARTYSYGGGCGVDLSKLRPNGSIVNNSAKTSSGAVSFMDLLSSVTGTICQAGRRGALMISMSCDHPDIEEFIKIKSDLSKVNKANISVRMTDDFMQDVGIGNPHTLHFENDKCNISKTVNSLELFNEFVKTNWDYAEPGCLFWDRIEKYNFLDHVQEFKYGGTNPCAEEPLPDFGACNLGSMNLSEYVVMDLYFDKSSVDTRYIFDFDTFKKDVWTCVYALNDVLIEGLKKHPLPEQRKTVGELRQIGLGIMGLGDMLIKLGIKYGSDESIELCEKIAKTMINTAVRASVDYMKSDTAYKYDMDSPHKYYSKDTFLSSNFVLNAIDAQTREYVVSHEGMFNSQLLTCAPTGTLSTMLNISGGIEPLYARFFTRKTQSLEGKDTYYKVYPKVVRKYMETHNIKDDSDLPEYFATAMEIDYHDRIDMQSVWQKYIDASISSTVNLPNSSTVEDVKNLYLYAWRNGLKGVTIFRDGCARLPVLSTDTNKKDSKPEKEEPKRGDVVTKHELFGLKRTIQTGCGRVHVAAYFDRKTGEFVELFLGKGSKGGCLSTLNGLARMVSLSARGGVPLKDIVDQLNSANVCPSYAVRTAIHKDTSKGSCCPSAIANALIDMENEMKMYLASTSVKPNMAITDVKLYAHVLPANKIKEIITADNVEKCPECGEPMERTCGCVSCPSCGWSKCS